MEPAKRFPTSSSALYPIRDNPIIRQRGSWVVEAIILILIISSFAWWCFLQGSKSREKSELDEVEARSEDMYRRYIKEDAELRAKSLTPSTKSTARGQATPTSVMRANPVAPQRPSR